MKKIAIVACVLVFILSGSCCSKEDAPLKEFSGDTAMQEPETTVDAGEESDDEDSAVGNDSPVESEEHPYEYVLSPDFDRQGGISLPSSYGEALVFDFKELSDKGYPSGEWTVDEIENKYGVAKDAYGVLGPTDINIWIEYEKMSIVLKADRRCNLSFNSTSNPQGEYPINDADKNIKISIASIMIKDEAEIFIRGIWIGESTIEQVKAAYPPGAGDAANRDGGGYSIIYNYVDFDQIALSSGITTKDTGSLI